MLVDFDGTGRCPACGAVFEDGSPVASANPALLMAPNADTARILALASAMRAAGVGRATLGDLTLDLTEAPLPEPPPSAAPRATARTMTEEELREAQARTLYAAGAGKRVVLR